MAQRIMVINDTQEILELFDDLLSGEGYTVSLHSYSTRDLQEVREIMPDLIISDHPPFLEENGWQFLQKLKMDRATEYIPVILCTTSLKWLRSNVDEAWLTAKRIVVLPKPFNIDELLDTVRTAFERFDVHDAKANAPTRDP